jgi:hypothetical protein
VALTAYSFGGLVLKSLMVEAHKHVHQRPRNAFDDEVQKCCKTFLNNVKGVIFYGVPHAGGTQYLSNYFTWQHQQINTLSKYVTQYGFLKNLESFNTQMEYLSMDFKNVVHEDFNIYAFGEGLQLDKKWARFHISTLKVIQLGLLVEHFFNYQNMCGIMYSILLNILMW